MVYKPRIVADVHFYYWQDSRGTIYIYHIGIRRRNCDRGHMKTRFRRSGLTTRLFDFTDIPNILYHTQGQYNDKYSTTAAVHNVSFVVSVSLL